MNNKVVILYSSGLDSLVNLAILKDLWKLDPVLLFIDYGQKAAELELKMTEKLSEKYNIPLIFQPVNLNVESKLVTGTSDVDIDIQDGREAPVDLVPYRNAALAHIGIVVARKINASFVSFGFNISEAGAYPDNTPRFLDALNELYMSSTYYPYEPIIKFISGSIHFTKTELVVIGKYLGVDFSLSTSCYYPVDGKACGTCNSCKYRIEAFKRAGYKDDIEYAIPIDWKSKSINVKNISELLEVIDLEKQKHLEVSKHV